MPAHAVTRPASVRLPYGLVMATGGASTMATVCGLVIAADVLLALAVIQGVWIALAAMHHHGRAVLNPKAIGRLTGTTGQQAGRLTVPLGLTIVLAGFANRIAAAMPAFVLVAFLVLAWLVALVCLGRFIASLWCRPLHLPAVDGVWFLAPAVLLGLTIATHDVSPFTIPAAHRLLAWLAAAAMVIGVLGYGLVLVIAGMRVLRHGLTGASRVPWWIAAGCAGLATAAVASVQQSGIVSSHSLISMILNTLMQVVFVVGLILLIAIVVMSIDFLCRRCRFENPASWPPTFSTAVMALGALGLSRALHAHDAFFLATSLGWATLLLWLVSGLWNVRLLIRNR